MRHLCGEVVDLAAEGRVDRWAGDVVVGEGVSRPVVGDVDTGVPLGVELVTGHTSRLEAATT